MIVMVKCAEWMLEHPSHVLTLQPFKEAVMPASDPIKLCSICGSPVNGDCYAGQTNRHKHCHREAIKAKRAEKADYYREYDRNRHANDPVRREFALTQMKKWAKENPSKAQAIKNSWAERNPNQRSAHNAFSNAVRDKKITRIHVCEICGSSNTEAHHHDYAKPLDVWWLCDSCHKRIHVLIRSAFRNKTSEAA